MRGKVYRRAMKSRKQARLREIIGVYHGGPRVGYIAHSWIEGEWQPKGAYIRYPKNSNIQKHLKRQSKRKVRRSESFQNGNSYRKCIEYRWQFW